MEVVPLDVKIYHRLFDTHPLAELYVLACTAEKQSGKRDEELMDACLGAIKQALTEKSEIPFNAIDAFEIVLLEDEKYPGKAVVLERLVYGGCATDGRTKAWLEEYCEFDEHKTEIVQAICLELANKACGQSQNSSSTNSASTAN